MLRFSCATLGDVGVPEHLWRFPTREAIDSLAERFNLPNAPEMQDWQWEVADPGRLDDFLAAYLNGDLSDDERFALMEMLLQCFEESDINLALDPRWTTVLRQLDKHIDLHAYTVWYWSCLDDDDAESWFRATPSLREILQKHRTRLQDASDRPKVAARANASRRRP